MIAESVSQPHAERTTVYTLPRFLSEIQHITTVDTGALEFVICCDRMKLYIFPLIAGANKPLGNIHQSLPIPNIKSLRTIAKNYLMIETQNKYIGIFQIIKSTSKQSPTQKPVNPFQINTVKVQFSEVLKWRTFSCYFIRQVMENLFEVQVFFNDMEFEIFQFTIKNKRGSMSFTILPNGKIQKSNKKQLYGSKCFFNIGRKLMYWLKNFSDKQFAIQELSLQPPLGNNKLLNEPFAYFGVQRSEEYKQIYPNLMIRDCINPAKRFGLKFDKGSFLNELKAQIAQLAPSKRKQTGQENPFNELVQQSSYMDNITQILESLKITAFTDMLMVENRIKKEVQIYQIKGDGSELIGKQSSKVQIVNDSKQKKSPVQSSQTQLLELRKWEWHFGNSKKLIAIDKLGFQLKYIQEISLQKENQNIIEAEVINMNEKAQQLKGQAQTEKPQEKKAQIQVESQETQQNSQKQKDKANQEVNEPKRKFSKDQLEQFCQQFKEEDAEKYVSKQLIKKVNEVNHWVKKEISISQKPQTIKSLTFKTKNPPLSQEVKKQPSEIKISQKHQNILKQQNQSIPMKQNDEVKQQKPSSMVQQENLTVKEKPPMKIIQRNKISVAKNFLSANQSKQNQEEKKEETKKQTQRTKDEVQTQKTSKGETNKTQNHANLFTKFRVKDESVPQVLHEKEKKRFMNNYLNQQKKEETNEVEHKQPQMDPIQHDSQQKNTNSQKEEKMKFNVITRASLLKKKQVDATENKQTEKQENSEAKILLQTELKTSLTQQKPSVSQQIESKSQSLKTSEEQKPQQEKCEQMDEIQSEPKTKFIPSIDIGKASKNHLNDCDFLSEDSVSIQDKNQGNPKIVQNEENANEQSIEEEIDGQQNDEPQNKDEVDLEHLIDDDINAEKVIKVEPKVVKQQKIPQINQEEQIQKFCNTLLDEQQIPKYQKKQPQSPIQKPTASNISQITDSITSHNSTPSFKLETSNPVTSKILPSSNVQKKEVEDEMNKFNSLLFKTSIKRTNIFSSENLQCQQRNQQKATSNQQRELAKKHLKSPKIDQIKEEIKFETQILKQEPQIQQSPKQNPSVNPVNKKSKDWHGSSSEQQNEQTKVKKTQNQILKLEQPSQQTIQIDQQVQLETKPPVLTTQNTIALEIPFDQGKSKSCESSVPQKITVEKIPQITPIKSIKPTENGQKKQPMRNPFFQALGQVPEKNLQPNVSETNIFSNTKKTILGQFIPSQTLNSLGNSFLSTNSMINQLPKGPLPRFLGLPPPTVVGGSNSNMFKKFLFERENKKKQEPKKQEENKEVSTKLSEIKKTQILNQVEVFPIAQRKQPQKKPSQQLMIPISALPQIQQMISKYEQTTIQRLEEQQKMIIKSLEQIPHTHNPYNKNNSLLLPEEIKEEIIKQSKNSVKKWLSTKMLDKIEVSFREIMQQHKYVYEEALKFYETEARKKITTMQLQYEQQSSILMDIENVSANMCAALQSSILQGEELHTYQLKEWKQQIQQTQASMVDPLANKIEDSRSYFETRNKNLEHMTHELQEIKEILKEKLKKKQEMKQLKQKKKQQKQDKLKQKLQEQAKLQMLKLKQQTKKQSKKRKTIDENEGHVSFYSHAPQRHNQAQHNQAQHYARQKQSYAYY